MTVPDPVGLFSLAKHALRTSVATCAEFQDWCEVATVADALERVYLEIPPLPLEECYTEKDPGPTKPFGVVHGFPFEGRADSADSAKRFEHAGTLILQLIDVYDERMDLTELFARFDNRAGVILEEMEALTMVGGCLAFDRWELEEPPGLAPKLNNNIGYQAVHLAIAFPFGGSP